jgi:hypothetical protein
MRHRPGGFSLAAVLIAVQIACLVAGILTATCFFSFNATGLNIESIHARQAADSITAAAVEHVMATNAVASPSPTYVEQLSWGSQGFSANAAMGYTAVSSGSLFAPASTYNLADVTLHGPAGPIPPFSVDVIAAGLCGNATCRTEAIVCIPPYPFAIASAGPINSHSGLDVEGVASGTTITPALLSNHGAMLPADIASNSPLSIWAVWTLPSTHVSGDVLACGGIQVPPSSVAGAVQAGCEPVPLPAVPVNNYVPPASKVMTTLSGTQGPTSLEGYCLAQDNCTINGALTLTSAVVYVSGDLVVHGPVMGNGAIFVAGNTVIDAGQQASDLTADNVVALAATGDVTLVAASRANNFFRGVISTTGNFNASHITLMGSFIEGTSPTGTAQSMNLVDVSAVHVPDYESMTMQVRLPPPPVPAISCAFQADFAGGVLPSPSPTPGTPTSIVGVTYDPDYAYRIGTDARGHAIVTFFDPPDDPASPSSSVAAMWNTSQKVAYPIYIMNGQKQVPSYTLTDPCSITFSSTSMAMTSSQVFTSCSAYSHVYWTVQNSRPTNDDWFSTGGGQSDLTALQALIDSDLRALATLTTNARQQAEASAATESWSMSLNQFIGAGDRVRLLLWRSL